jgi:choline dehydrogenase-like flavoprotein
MAIPIQRKSAGLAPDPIQEGLAAGWKVIDLSTLEGDREFEADVAIIGSGAGGGVTAEILTLAGLKVLLIEEGPLKSSRDFKMREADAYPELYQESAARKTRDKAINILQGRNVGGSTTVNWTASFRTPESTLAYWQKNFGLHDYGREQLAPWFGMMEQRLSISPWAAPPNPNNDVLRRGGTALGIPTAAIPRNVKGCWNIGYCGMGCPTNAKQSMLVTTIPAALAKGATLLTRARAENFTFKGDTVAGLRCVALDASGLAPSGKIVTVRARHYVVAAGAINTPALLMRSKAPDPHGLLGKRTFLHPTVLCAALFEQKIEGFSGAPQSVYSDHFLQAAVDGPIGYKLETPPLHPLLFASTMQGFGAQHAAMMKHFAHAHVMLALLRDGFHEGAPGGAVQLKDDGSPVLDYPITEFLWDGVRRAHLSMAEIQFAAGAKSVHPVHELAEGYTSWSTAKKAIAELSYKPLLARVVSAHVMGGCPISDDVKQGLVSSRGAYHGVANLSVHDGSLFPTSLGANPQLSIYGITARLASGLAEKMTGNKTARLSPPA